MDSKGTIVYIGGFELPDRNAAAHQVLNNARILKNIGYKVVFCGIDKTIDRSQSVFHEQVFGFDSYPVPYPKTTREWIANMLDFEGIKRVIETEKDVKFVIAYNVHAIPLQKTIKYCHANGIKIIANVTEWYENPFAFSPGKAIRWLDTILVMTKYHKKVDGIIAVSRYLQNYYKNVVDNIIVMPPFVDIHEDKWASSSVHIVNERVEFIYSGTIEKGAGDRKDKLCPIIECFDALSNAHDFHFSIVGISREQFEEQFPDMVRIIDRLDDRITFYGRVPHAESINKLKLADYCIFVRDSTRKNNAGFPTKFVESWTSGVNIIASDISDISEYFPNDGISILLNNNERSTISSAIQRALSFSPSDLSEQRRDGLTEGNPFYYMNWVEPLGVFLNSLLNNNKEV